MIDKEILIKYTKRKREYELQKAITYCEKRILKASKKGLYEVDIVCTCNNKLEKYKKELESYFCEKRFMFNLRRHTSTNTLYITIGWKI